MHASYDFGLFHTQCYFGDNPRGEFNDGSNVQARIEAGGFDLRAYQIWYENSAHKVNAKPG